MKREYKHLSYEERVLIRGLRKQWFSVIEGDGDFGFKVTFYIYNFLLTDGYLKFKSDTTLSKLKTTGAAVATPIVSNY